MVANLAKLWERFEALQIVPGVVGRSILAEGASEASIRDFEQSAGVRLPAELVESYARHNGQREGTGYYAFWGGNFLSLEEVLEERAARIRAASDMFGPLSKSARHRPATVSGPAQREWWIPEWLPVVKRNKEPICADLRPAAGGRIGQLVEVDWEGGSVRVIAASFTEFLGKCCEMDA